MNGHIDDRDLVRHLDGEDGAPDGVAEHLERCPECRDRLRRLERRSAAVSALLSATEPALGEPEYDAGFLETLREARAAPDGGARVHSMGDARERRRDPRGRAGRLRWAAALALLAAGLSVTPARAWIVRAAASAWEAIVGGDAGAPPPGDGPEAAAPDDPTEVRTRVDGPRVTLRIEGPSRPGEVVLRGWDEPTAAARLEGGGAGEILVVPGGFRIRAAPGDARLVVSVPRDLAEVVVEVDGEEAARRPPPDPAGPGWSLSLREP